MKRLALFSLTVFVFACLSGPGCRVQTGPGDAPLRTVAGKVGVGPEWVEIDPVPPLEATSRFQFIGLRIPDVAGTADDRRETIRLRDGSQLRIDLEIVGTDGNVTRLYPNGFAERVEFGKRTENRTRPEEAEFRVGSKFSKIRLRSDKVIEIQEVVWMESGF